MLNLEQKFYEQRIQLNTLEQQNERIKSDINMVDKEIDVFEDQKRVLSE
jgi:hypothetical protein